MGGDSSYGEPFYKGTPDMIDRGFPEDFSLSNGNYICRCRVCGEYFMGYKGRTMCKPCEEKACGATDQLS